MKMMFQTNTKAISAFEKKYADELKKLGVKTEKEIKEDKVKFMETLKPLLQQNKIAG